MIEITKLTKRYEGGKTALDEVTFKINSGEICGYIGENGAGKTTTIKIISGALDFDSGTVEIFDIDVKKNPNDVKKIMGYVPESGNIFNSLRISEYLHFTGRIRNLEEVTIDRRIQYFAELFEYTEYLNSSIGSLSKGTKQKVLITSALLHNPKIILLDEPLNGLDANSIFVFQDMIKILSEKSRTIFYCSHLLDIIEKISTRLIILEKGRIKLDSDANKLKSSENYKGLENLFKDIKGEREYKKFIYEEVFD